MSDWDLDSPFDDTADYMPILELAMIEEEGKECIYTITTRIFYQSDCTRCEISYRKGKGSNSTINLIWDSDLQGSQVLKITRTVEQTSYLLFSKSILETCYIEVFDCRHLSWCFFQDARRHLERIRS